MHKRQIQILDILGEKKLITVLELSELLKVSDVTIRSVCG